MRHALTVLLLGALLPGCRAPEPDGGAAAADTAAAHADGGTEAAHADDLRHADAEGLALRPIMQRLGAEMAAMQQALWLEEHAAIEEHAAAVAGHTRISEEENARIAGILGAELGAFRQADEEVHEAALRMHAAARDRDLPALVERLADVQRGCVACHARFRARLRTTS